MLDRRNNIDQPHHGTCQWVVDLLEYKNWQSQSHGLLWIKGHPGSGKSTLMAHLHNSLRNDIDSNQSIKLTFFCLARGTELQRSALGLFRSLLNQLYTYDEASRELIRESFSIKHRAYGYNLKDWSWQESEVKDLFIRAMLSTSMTQQVQIFIDALDELGETAARELARCFHHINDIAVRDSLLRKICISSRHYPIVSAVSGTEIWVERYNGDDIAAYVNDHLAISDVDESDQTRWQNLKSEVLERAAGIFQWACLVVPMIEKLFLDGVPISEIQTWVRQVPTELGQVYEHIIRNIVNPNDRRHSALLFQWVCLAGRPLTLREFRYALACKATLASPDSVLPGKSARFVDSDQRMAQRVKSLQGGLLQILPRPLAIAGEKAVHSSKPEHGSLIVQVVHQSVNDYLVASGLQLLFSLVDSRYPSGDFANGDLTNSDDVIKLGHLNIYHSCINYLTIVSNSLSTTSEPLPDWNLYFHDPIQEPLVDYAALYLLEHAQKVGGFLQHQLICEIKQLQQILDFWQRRYRELSRFDPNSKARHYNGSSLLHVAAMAGLSDVVGFVVSDGFEIDKRCSGKTALHWAAQMGHLQTVQILQQAGADLQATNGPDYWTPLIFAVYYNRVTTVTWLSKQQSRLLPSSSAEFSTALTLATTRASTELVQILIEHGADANTRMTTGMLLGVTEYQRQFTGFREIMQILLDNGAEPNRFDDTTFGPFHLAASGGTIPAVRNFLLAEKHGDDMRSESRGAIEWAASFGDETLVANLIDESQKNGDQTADLDRALWFGARRGHLATVKILVGAGANVNFRNHSKRSVLMAAIGGVAVVGWDVERLVEWLLSEGAQPNLEDVQMRVKDMPDKAQLSYNWVLEKIQDAYQKKIPARSVLEDHFRSRCRRY